MSFFEVIDPKFSTFIIGTAPVKKITTGFD